MRCIDWTLGVVAALAAAVCGCAVGDIFGTSNKELAAGYCLELWREGDSYRIQGCPGSSKPYEDGIGLFQGTVSKIGWSDQYIVGWRNPAFGDEKPGWMVLDVSTDQIDGPLTDAEFSRLRAQRPPLRLIVL
jgi:hypothetical protein